MVLLRGQSVKNNLHDREIGFNHRYPSWASPLEGNGWTMHKAKIPRDALRLGAFRVKSEKP